MIQLGKIFTIFKKELKESLRDREVLLTNFLTPVLGTPLLYVFMFYLGTQYMEKTKTESYKVGINHGHEILRDKKLNQYKFAASPNFLIDSYSDDDIKKQLKSNQYDLYMSLVKKNEQWIIDFFYDGSSKKSTRAVKKLKTVLEEHKELILKSRLKNLNKPLEFAKPIIVQENQLSPKEKIIANNVGSSIGAFLILILVLSMYHPSIHSIVNEREKNIHMSVLITPVKLSHVLTGKYFNIAFQGLLGLIPYLFNTTLISLIAFKSMYRPLQYLADPTLILSTLTMALFIASLCFFFCSLSQKAVHAQALMSSLLFLTFIPIVALIFIDSEVVLANAFVPILNYCLVFQSSLAHGHDGLFTLVTNIINLLGAVLVFKLSLKAYEWRTLGTPKKIFSNLVRHS